MNVLDIAKITSNSMLSKQTIRKIYNVNNRCIFIRLNATIIRNSSDVLKLYVFFN